MLVICRSDTFSLIDPIRLQETLIFAESSDSRTFYDKRWIKICNLLRHQLTTGRSPGRTHRKGSWLNA
jgi:hypothetical protein